MRYLLILLLLLVSPVWATTYYLDPLNGLNSNSGLDTSNEIKDISHAMDIAGPGDIFYLEADQGDYDTEDGANNAVGVTSTAGTAANPITWIGYTDVITDGGKATINADPVGDQYTNCIDGDTNGEHHNWRNCVFTGASGTGYWKGSTGDNGKFDNCVFSNSGVDGLHGDNGITVSRCTFSGNTGQGLDADVGIQIIVCFFYTNLAGGALLNGGDVISSLFYDNSGGPALGITGNGRVTVSGCTFDGENAALNAIEFSSGSRSSPIVVANCIIYDASTGVESASVLAYDLALNNLTNSNTDDYFNFPTGINDVTGAPQFVNEAGDDYRLDTGGPAIAAGIDSGSPTSFMDIGALQKEAVAGGGDAATWLINGGLIR